MDSLFRRITALFPRRQRHPLEPSLGYCFRNMELLQRALMHRSYAYETEGGRTESNERMEFLGDAILDLVVTSFLFRTYPDKQEGDLSKIKSLVVSKPVLRKAADKMGLGAHLYISVSEERTGGRKRISILADAFEAVIAAIYLDGGLAPAERFIHATVLRDLDEHLQDESHTNYKSELLEATQSRGLGTPVYDVLSESGPDHNKTFDVCVKIRDDVWGRGRGKNKKSAEQEAAHDALSNKRDILTPSKIKEFL